MKTEKLSIAELLVILQEIRPTVHALRDDAYEVMDDRYNHGYNPFKWMERDYDAFADLDYAINSSIKALKARHKREMRGDDLEK